MGSNLSFYPRCKGWFQQWMDSNIPWSNSIHAWSQQCCLMVGMTDPGWIPFYGVLPAKVLAVLVSLLFSVENLNFNVPLDHFEAFSGDMAVTRGEWADPRHCEMLPGTSLIPRCDAPMYPSLHTWNGSLHVLDGISCCKHTCLDMF